MSFVGAICLMARNDTYVPKTRFERFLRETCVPRWISRWVHLISILFFFKSFFRLCWHSVKTRPVKVKHISSSTWNSFTCKKLSNRFMCKTWFKHVSWGDYPCRWFENFFCNDTFRFSVLIFVEMLDSEMCTGCNWLLYKTSAEYRLVKCCAV